MTDSNDLDGARAPHARVIARTDGAGALRAFDAVDGASQDGKLALAVDLAAAALARLGEQRGIGRLRSALVVFDDAVIAIGSDDRERNVVVIGDGTATQGLVLSHLHRLLAKTGEADEER
jgi:hypothetical protein